MANDRLHIICGNCGSAEMFEVEIKRDAAELPDGTFQDDAYIWCRNCGTLHTLRAFAERQKEKADHTSMLLKRIDFLKREIDEIKTANHSTN